MNPINPIVLLSWLLNEQSKEKVKRYNKEAKRIVDVSPETAKDQTKYSRITPEIAAKDKKAPKKSDKPKTDRESEKHKKTKAAYDNLTKPQNTILSKKGGGCQKMSGDKASKFLDIPEASTADEDMKFMAMKETDIAVLIENGQPLRATSPENRKKYIESNAKAIGQVALGMAKLKTSSAAEESAAMVQLSADMMHCKNSAELDTAFAKALNAGNDTYKSSVLKNLSEIYIHSKLLLDGKEAYMPTHPNYPVADVIVIERNLTDSRIISIGFTSVKSGENTNTLGAASAASGLNKHIKYSDDIATNRRMQKLMELSLSASTSTLKKAERKELNDLFKTIDTSGFDAKQISYMKVLQKRVSEYKDNLPKTEQAKFISQSTEIGRLMFAIGRKLDLEYQGVIYNSSKQQFSTVAYGPCKNDNIGEGYEAKDKGNGRSMKWMLHPNNSCKVKNGK